MHKALSWSFALLITVQFAIAQTRTIDSLQQIVALQRRDTTELNAYIGLCFEFLRKDLSKSKGYAHRAVSLAQQLNEVTQLGHAYFYLVTSNQNTGQLDSALYYLDLLEKLSVANPKHWKMAANFNQAAGLYYKNTGQPKKALPYMLKNLESVQGSDESRAGLMLNIGNIYTDLGDYKESGSYYMRSLRLFEKVGNRRGQSYALNSLGTSSLYLGQAGKAKEYLEKSLSIKKELGDQRGMVSSQLSLGDVYKELGQLDRSESFYIEGLRAAKQVKVPIEEARAHHQLGLLYKRKGELEKARESMKKGLALAQSGGDSLMSAKIRSEMVGIDMKEAEQKQTEQTLLADLKTITAAGDKGAEAVEYNRLSDFYAHRGQFEKAFYYSEKYHTLDDSLKGSSVVLQLKELEEKYRSEKQEKEIEHLKAERELNRAEVIRQRDNLGLIGITLISVIIIAVLLVNRYRVANRSRRLIELERMRNHIARDLHDDLGSTLSSINIMSQLAMKEKGDTGTHLKKIATHSARMMETMSDIVWSISPGNDSLDQMTAKMKEFAAEILEPKEIDFTFLVDPTIIQMKLDLERRKNVFLIFKEAVNNAAKYSEAANLAIHFGRVNGSLRLSVADNGRGYDPATVVQGNGLKNMADRAQGMNGKLVQTSEPGKGSSVTLEIPIT